MTTPMLFETPILTHTLATGYPITIRDDILYFDTSYHAINGFIGGLGLTFNHVYRVTLSRNIYHIYNCNNYPAVQVNATGNAVCSNGLPLSLTDLSGDGLLFRATMSGSGSLLFMNFSYRFHLAGYTEVVVEDLGPAPSLGFADIPSYPLLQDKPYDNDVQVDEADCPDCHM